MRVGQGAQLVPVVLRRLVVTGFADLDREQVRRYFALMHDNVGVNRLSQMIVCRDDGAVGQPQRPLAEPVVVAIDLPPRKLVFQMDGQPVRQRALAQIMLEQEALAAIKLGERRHDFVQLRLHRLPRHPQRLRGAQVQSTTADTFYNWSANLSSRARWLSTV